jgi:capsid protein
MNIFTSIKNKLPTKTEDKPPIDQYTEKDFVNYYVRDMLDSVWNGDKYLNSFGVTKQYTHLDYYSLRMRSVQLFRENQYAKGIIRRLITNLVYKGHELAASPIAKMIGMTDEQAIEWAEETELQWELWSKDSNICDYNQLDNLGQIEEKIKQTALISGDCLVIMDINRITKLPHIRIIDGSHVQTPINYEPRKGNHIKYGVEFRGKKQVAYHVYVEKKDGFGYEYKRIPAYGEKSGRKIAWLVIGSNGMLDDVRGEPILASMLSMLKDLDRYRDSSARAAVVNSLYPFLIKKVEKGVGGMPFGAVKRSDAVNVSDSDGVSTQTLKFGYDNPGTVPSLPYGTDIAPLNFQKSDINLGNFEEIIINVCAWSIELPPETLTLLYQSNFSASRQANNELQLVIDKEAWKAEAAYLGYIYEEWLISSVIIGNIKADGLIDSWINNDWLTYNAWLSAEFTGLSRPSVDGYKDAMEEEKKLQLGVTTFDKVAKKLSKMKFRTVVQQRNIEQKLMERFGLVSSVDENNNGEPVQEGNDNENNNNNNNKQSNNNKNQNNQVITMLYDITDRLDNLEGKK